MLVGKAGDGIGFWAPANACALAKEYDAEVYHRALDNHTAQRNHAHTKLPFHRVYFFRFGFLDGTPGFIYHHMHAHVYPMMTDIKYLERQKQYKNTPYQNSGKQN